MRPLRLPLPRRLVDLVVLCALPFSVACSSDGSGKAEKTDPDPAPESTADQLNFDTPAFSVTPGKEEYKCFTKTVDEDVWIDRFQHDNQKSVHHMVLVKTLAPEPDEPFDCPTFFKPTWIPLFATGTSSADLETPEGSSFPIPKGTQLLLQLHLLNTGDEDVSQSVTVKMHTVPRTPRESGVYGFGTTVIDLPPGKTTSVSNDCVVQNTVDAFALFPHMHTLGKSLTFEVGPDADHLKEVYRVDPWDFGNQFILAQELTLNPGDVTRTTCTFDNPGAESVTFGESTHNEMCFFTVFRSDFTALDGCVNLAGWASLTPGGSGG